jgi:hypothetical protein
LEKAFRREILNAKKKLTPDAAPDFLDKWQVQRIDQHSITMQETVIHFGGRFLRRGVRRSRTITAAGRPALHHM